MSDEWEEWKAKVRADLGFMSEKHLQSPIIWSKVGGRYIGGCEELQQFAVSKFGCVCVCECVCVCVCERERERERERE